MGGPGLSELLSWSSRLLPHSWFATNHVTELDLSTDQWEDGDGSGGSTDDRSKVYMLAAKLKEHGFRSEGTKSHVASSPGPLVLPTPQISPVSIFVLLNSLATHLFLFVRLCSCTGILRAWPAPLR